MPDENDKKILVVYYSHDESTKSIAESIANETNADLLELKPLDEKSVSMNPIPPLEPFSVDPNEYDLIFLGSPVWAMSYAPPVESFLRKATLSNKNIALFCTHEGLMGIVFQEMISKLSDNKIVGAIDFYDPIGSGVKYAANASANWARQVLKSIN
ncbi:MAG: Flavodoxin [Mesotoga infera]|uniref:Flavodoxin n=1 Tax=Mesotoga infera TaxID=1236046 RepID=A0A101I4R9_9BACT|nr:MAG: Flavodoxin [Mesotoga infera]